MDNGRGREPPQKRARRSHGRNQLAEFCECGRCRGLVAQHPSTIRDHRTRYPRRVGPGDDGDAPAEPTNPPGSPQGHALGDVTNSPHPRRRAAPSSPKPRSEPHSPDENRGIDDLPEGSDNGHRSNPSTAPPSPIRPARNARVRGDEDDDELPDWAPNRRREYDFGQLLGDLDRGMNRQHHGHEFDEALDFPPGMVPEAGGDLDDVDFGLPGNGDEPAEAEQPGFRFPIQEEPGGNPDEEPEEPEEPAGGEDFCAAFQEPELIRNSYIDAFIQKTLYGATHRALRHQLKCARRAAACHPDIHVDDLAKMAQTISTVERRLGLSYADFITTYTLCRKCGKRYDPAYIARTINHSCLNDGCGEELFLERSLASGSKRRVSHLTFPVASIIAWLKHVLSQPGMAEVMQSWRQDDDLNNGQDAPVPCEEWMANLDMDTPLVNISNGYAWRSTAAGLERAVSPVSGDVSDVSPQDPPIRFSGLPFGISFSMNTDWFQTTKEGCHSSGACYLVINNLPRHMRFLRENICLALMMPGPSEPSDYALDQMLTPLIDELLELKQGVVMTIREGDPAVYREQVVHGELSHHIADLIARIKLGGGAGVSTVSYDAYGLDFAFRDPEDEVNNAYYWKSLRTHKERRAFFDFTGNRFTALHRLPNWYTTTCSPIDTMHLLYLGGMNWILKQILVGPGMLTKRHANDTAPIDLFNTCLDEMWLGQTKGRIKSDQLKLASRIVVVPLYLAMQDGDEIQPNLVPRGRASTTGAKHQASKARQLHQYRCKFFESIGQPELSPTLEQCYPSRNLQFHFQQVLRYSLAVNTIDKRSITPDELSFAQRLLETMCVEYACENVALSPNFHYMMHLEESILRTGSVYNTHVWGMERANGILSKLNHNGRGGGMVEGTYMRGWWSHMTLRNLINMLRALPNPTPADQEVLQDLLVALQGSPEHVQQQGTLMAFIARTRTAYGRLHGIQEPTVLSNQSRVIDLNDVGLYQLVLEHCQHVWPDVGIFGPGMVQNVYLSPEGMVRNYSWVEHDGLRYGSYHHTSGRAYCYGYLDDRVPVRVERILHVDIPRAAEPNLQTICVLVREFLPPLEAPSFPWDTWAGHMGISSWACDTLSGEPGFLVSANRLSGHFALFRVAMSYGMYWVTVSLDSVSPERDPDEG